ncbi:hypothetical protein BaRGS_00005834 [Batillaria attramentaria]|uniref:Uncharacterized protein n=1 Tax=Batillaria attramentaria TaxID=370345 RepID=A0ABD0LTM7_9CAEN
MHDSDTAREICCRKKLDSLTGEQIAFLHRLRTEAPEFFYNMLRTELQIKTLTDLLQITKALDSLANV